MSLYQHILKVIIEGEKNNLQEKLRGSNKFEFKEICDHLESKYHVKPRDLMGLGTSCWVFNYQRKGVIKICAKKIKFFHHRDSRSAVELQKTAQTLAPSFLPVSEILYDGDEFFVYVQEKCTPLPKKKPVSHRDLLGILQIIETMLSHGLLVGQIKPKNVGYWEDKTHSKKTTGDTTHEGGTSTPHLVLFDYHSMHPLYQRMESKKDWYGSLVDALVTYQQLSGVNLSPLRELIKKSKTPADIQEVIQHIKHLQHTLQKHIQ